MRIPFNDLRPTASSQDDLVAAARRVIESGWYVLGAEVDRFERELASYLSIEHVVGVASGTEAITVALMALGISRGDEVLCPDMTAFPSVVGIAMTGADPVFVDVCSDSGLLDVDAAERAITSRTRAIVVVHLYGQAADVARLRALADAQGLRLVEDCAQALGTSVGGRRVGTFGDAAAFSFYPTKNLGALGDGGAVATHSTELAARLRGVRNYGQSERDQFDTAGLNSRLDEIQAAFLTSKLPLVDDAIAERRRLARMYEHGLAGAGATPLPRTDPGDTFHLFVVQSRERDRVRRGLADAGIQTHVHYPVPCRRQPAARSWWQSSYGSTWASDEFAASILSLPLWAGLGSEAVASVSSAMGALS